MYNNKVYNIKIDRNSNTVAFEIMYRNRNTQVLVLLNTRLRRLLHFAGDSDSNRSLFLLLQTQREHRGELSHGRTIYKLRCRGLEPLSVADQRSVRHRNTGRDALLRDGAVIGRSRVVSQHRLRLTHLRSEISLDDLHQRLRSEYSELANNTTYRIANTSRGLALRRGSCERLPAHC